MRIRIIATVFAGLLVMGAAGCSNSAGTVNASGGDGAPKVPINAKMAGASPQGYFRLLGENINSVVRNEYPGSSIAYIPGSPAGSLAQVATGRAELAVAITPVEERLADEGRPPFKEPLEGQYQSLMQIHQKQALASVANQSWTEEYDIQTWEDVAREKPPMRIAINQTGNVQVLRVAESYFEQHGFNFEDIERWGGSVEYVSSGEGIALLQDRRADVFFNTPGFIPDSDLEEVARSVDLSWVSMQDEKVQAVAEEWNLLTGAVTPEDHEFITREEQTILWPTDLIVNPDMTEDDAYRITRAIFENKGSIQNIHPAMRDFSAERGVRSADRVTLHPGAKRFYEEAGIL